MAPQLKINAVAFISPQNHPILIRTFSKQEHPIKYHYIAHTSLDVVEERATVADKMTECYLGLLYTMEDVAVYGYLTPLKVKIILALALSDAIVRDAEVISIFKALHMAFYSAISNPFLKLTDGGSGPSPYLSLDSSKWKKFKQNVDDIARLVGGGAPSS